MSGEKRPSVTCPMCGAEFARGGRRVYCSDRCRKTRYVREVLGIQPHPEPEHGTNARYRAGCKCPDCLRAAREYRYQFGQIHVCDGGCGWASCKVAKESSRPGDSA